MPDTTKLDLRIQRLTEIKASYRSDIKHAQAALRDDPERRKRYERTIERRERRIEKLRQKIRHLRELRAAIRAR